jgi:hypothetical protein
MLRARGHSIRGGCGRFRSQHAGQVFPSSWQPDVRLNLVILRILLLQRKNGRRRRRRRSEWQRRRRRRTSKLTALFDRSHLYSFSGEYWPFWLTTQKTRGLGGQVLDLLALLVQKYKC